MGDMQLTELRTPCGAWRPAVFIFLVWTNSCPGLAQVNYAVHFEMDKASYLLGEPIFCRFVIQNTESSAFTLRYRSPTRSLAPDYEQEPRFVVTDQRGTRLPDPGPRPCGNSQGTTYYGSVSLPPGKVHTERWLLNQWAQFTTVGQYRVRAERRLALRRAGTPEEKPVAFALAIDELSVRVAPSTRAQIEAAFQPYLAAVNDVNDPDPAEAVMVLTSLPQPFFLDQLVAMTNAGKPDRWDRRDVLNGLARLNTPASWNTILKVFRGAPTATLGSRSKDAAAEGQGALPSYALLLLAEKADPAFIPTLTEMLAKSVEPLRGDILRALGFFHDPRAYEPIYDNLHSAAVTDRMNSILGLKNLGGKEVIPALLAALNDPEVQVRQVANFSLEGLTGYKVAVSASPSRQESVRVANQWHAWWREHAGSFSPPRPAPCHDW